MSDVVIPGIISAMADGRTGDAVELAQALLESGDRPEEAVLKMAIFANMLHQQPEMSLQQVAMMWSSTEDGIELSADHLTGVVMQEILEVLETWEGGGPSEAGQEILARFDVRPGSAEMMRSLCVLVSLLMSDLKLQMTALPPGRRSADAATKYAFDHARAVVDQSPPPNVFSTDYDDLP